MDMAVSRIETAIGAAAPIGRAVSAAMAVEGSAVVELAATDECVRVVDHTCHGRWPCDARVELRVDEACPLPLAAHAHGTVTMDVRFESLGVGTILAGFADVQRDEGLVVVEAEAVHATWIPGGAIGEYASARLRLADGRSPLAEGVGWSVVVHDGGTPGDPSDDAYLIAGAEGRVDDELVVVTVDGVLVDQRCAANPIGGTAHATVFTDQGTSVVEFAFHGACDGRADVVSMEGFDLDIDVGATIDLGFGA